MQPAYQVRLKSAAGALLGVFTQENLLTLRITHEVNAPSTHELTLDASLDDRCELFERDRQIEVWRRPAGAAWYLEYEGFHREAEWRQDADGKETFVSRGVGYLDLLRRRIIAAYAGSTGDVKSGHAETIAKAYVTEQLVSPSIAGRAVSGFSVEADGGHGPSVAAAYAYRNLLEALQEIARIGAGDFDVVGTGAAAWQFRWYDGQRGTDRRSTVIFATGYGNMREPQLTDYAAQANVALVLGQGEGTARTWVWRPGTPDTGQGRIEVMREGRNTDDAATLQALGDAELDKLAARQELGFQTLQTAGAQYGADYFLGDLVSARYRDVDYDLKIAGVTLELGAPDEITLKFESI